MVSEILLKEGVNRLFLLGLAAYALFGCVQVSQWSAFSTIRDDEFREAAQNGNLTKVKKFYGEGLNINTGVDGACYTALDAFMSNGHEEVARWLVDHGATLGPAQCQNKAFNKEWNEILKKAHYSSETRNKIKPRGRFFYRGGKSL